MSTTTPPSSSPSGSAHTTQANNRTGGPAQRKGGAQDATDLFASMLSLLSATTDVPALPQPGDAPEVLPTDPTPALQTPLSDTPTGDATLAAMMQWAALPQAGATSRGAAAATDIPPAVLADTSASGLTARAAPGAGSPDPMLQGMQVLTHPEAPDAQTLTALSPQVPEAVVGDAGTAASPAATPGTATGATPIANVAASPSRPSAAGRGQQPLVATHSMQQSHHDATQAERLQVRVQSDMAVALRSTVTLDERFLAAASTEAPATTLTGDAQILPSAAVGASAGAAPVSGTDLSGQTGGDPDTEAQHSASDHTVSEDGDADSRADEDWAQTQESLDAFASPTLRQASLRVGEAGEDAIDIRLSLTGQALDLGFRTDSAEARAALVRHAEGGLSELLQRGGIQLGDVSVSSQSGQSSGGHAQQAPTRSQTPPPIGIRGTSADTDEAPVTALRPRRDGNRPLDLFV